MQTSIDLPSTAAIRIDGTWSRSTHWEWHGVAKCPEPIVGIAILAIEGTCFWCKSGPASPHGQIPVRLALFQGFDEIQCVQVNLSVGDGGRFVNTNVARPDEHPEIRPRDSATTGEVIDLCSVGLESLVQVKVVFFQASFVRVGRNWIWNLRKPLRSSVSEPLRSVLSSARSGEFRA